MFKFAVCLLAFLWQPWSEASHLAISFGPSLNGGTNPKYASLGYAHDFGNLEVLAQCSGIFDSPFLGACSVVPSLKVNTPAGVFARVGVGPGFVTHKTARLSSIPEFNIRYAAGFDEGGYEVGVEGTHWSNASLFGGPNLGMDHVGFYLGIKL